MIASALVLGYHEDLNRDSNVPRFLVDIRKTAFARLYSADKNISIFLGRPPRMSKRFCHFQAPDFTHAVSPSLSQNDYRQHGRHVGYRDETRWSALCANLKEDILELSYTMNDEDRAEKIRYESEQFARYDTIQDVVYHGLRRVFLLRQGSLLIFFQRN